LFQVVLSQVCILPLHRISRVHLAMEFQLAQAQALLAGGLKVKNTFIDGPPDGGVVLVPRRATSASPIVQCCPREARELQDFMVGDILSAAKVVCPGMRPLGQRVSKSLMSTASAWSDDFGAESTDSETSSLAEPPKKRFPESGQGEPCATLQALIENECQFLLIHGCAVFSINQESRRKPLPVGVDKCLRVFIRGLPLARRTRWQAPLAWCVACVLKRAGCDTYVKRGELFVASGGTATEFVLVDFTAERA
jgi:hypothetical protein